MSDLIQNYIAVNIICAVALAVLSYSSWTHVLFATKMRKQFAITAIITTVVILSELITVVFDGISPEYRSIILAANVIGFSMSPFIAIVLSDAFAIEQGKTSVILSVPAWLNVLLVSSSPWTGWIFNINAEGYYVRGPLFMFYIMPTFAPAPS